MMDIDLGMMIQIGMVEIQDKKQTEQICSVYFLFTFNISPLFIINVLCQKGLGILTLFLCQNIPSLLTLAIICSLFPYFPNIS